jgi:NTE family protein
MSVTELASFVIEKFDIGELLESFVFKMNGPVGKVLQTGQMLGNFATKRGIDSGKRLEKLFEQMTSGKTFAETRIPFRCNALDLVSGKEIVFSSGAVAHAIRASMSFPAFFEPLTENGQCLVDGGLSDNMPVYIAREAGFKHILAIDVHNFKKLPVSALKNASQIVYRSFELAVHLMDKESGRKAALTIYASDETSVFNFYRKKELIKVGERAVRDNKQQLAAFFGAGFRAALTLRRFKKGEHHAKT